MGTPVVVVDGCAVVVRGHFNPAIISPAWLLHVELISGKQYGDTETTIVSEDITMFRTGWAQVQASREFFQVSTSDAAEFERLRDLASGVLAVLKHTPVSALGINRHAHLEVESRSAWHAVGDLLSPKSIWEGVLNLPGTQSVTMLGVRPDLYAGRVQVQVEPSSRLEQGIYVAHNDHYSLTRVERQPSSREEFGAEDPPDLSTNSSKISTAQEILSDSWSSAMDRSRAVVERVWDLIERAERTSA